MWSWVRQPYNLFLLQMMLIHSMCGVGLGRCSSRCFVLSELNLVVRSCVSVVSCQPSKDHWQVPWIVVSISWIEVRRCAQPGPRREPPRAAVEVRARCVSGGPGATPGHVVVLTLIPARGAEPSTLRSVHRGFLLLMIRYRCGSGKPRVIL